MPDQEHLILVLAREAEVITHDMSVFFAPARDFIEPGAGWPQDLTPGELGGLIPQLRRTIGWLSDVITQVVDGNQADPDKARLVTEGVRLIEQGDEMIDVGVETNQFFLDVAAIDEQSGFLQDAVLVKLRAEHLAHARL